MIPPIFIIFTLFSSQQLIDEVRICLESDLLILAFYQFWTLLYIKLYKIVDYTSAQGFLLSRSLVPARNAPFTRTARKKRVETVLLITEERKLALLINT
jgi:hypothetical protein